MMPNRMIREGLLDSGRYWAVTIEARQLFWHLMLLADDLGCVSLAPVFVRRRCFDDAPSYEKIAALISQLSDADLLRPYEVNGARFGFIPRFKQRLQRVRLGHPEPPSSLLFDDEDAKKKFKEIKVKHKNPTDEQLMGNDYPTAAHRPEVEVEVEVEENQPPPLSPPKGGKSSRRNAGKQSLPDDWQPSERTLAWAAREFGLRVPEDVERYVGCFRDYCASSGKRYADFDAAFRNVVRQDWPKMRNRLTGTEAPHGVVPEERL